MHNTQTPGSVLVVGSINVDLVVSTPMLPTRGETVTGGRFAQHNGGKGANQAVAAARMGAAVTFVGAVGNDTFGRAALEGLRGEGIDIARVAVLERESTGIALIVVDVHGQNQIAVAGGANAQVTGAFVDRALATAATAIWFWAGHIPCQSRAARRCRRCRRALRPRARHDAARQSCTGACP